MLSISEYVDKLAKLNTGGDGGGGSGGGRSGGAGGTGIAIVRNHR